MAINKNIRKIRWFVKNFLKINFDNSPFDKEEYWNVLAKYILARYKYNKNTFVSDPVISWHICSEDRSLSRRCIKNIKNKTSLNLRLIDTPPLFRSIYGDKLPTTLYTQLNSLAELNHLKVKISDCSVYEFGVGTGMFIEALEIFGYESISYIGIDLPEMCQLNLLMSLDRESSIKSNFYTFEDVDNVFNADSSRKIFYSHFAYSETPIPLRDEIENKILYHCDFIFIVYQEIFQGIDNIKYFKNLLYRLKSMGFVVENSNYIAYKNCANYIFAKKC